MNRFLLRLALSLSAVSVVAVACGGGGGGGGGGGSPTPTASVTPTATPTPFAALDFDGVNDIAAVQSTSTSIATITTALTIEAWINPRSLANPFGPVVWAGMVLPSNFSGGALLLGPEYFSVSTPGTNTTSPLTVATNAWSHIAGTYDGANIRFYVNGTASAPAVQTGPVAMNPYGKHLVLGGLGSGNYFDGRIEDVRIWNVVKTSAEIAASAGHRLTGTEPGLLAYWPLSEGTGQTAASIAGSNLDLQLGYAPVPDTADPLWSTSNLAPITSP